MSENTKEKNIFKSNNVTFSKKHDIYTLLIEDLPFVDNIRTDIGKLINLQSGVVSYSSQGSETGKNNLKFEIDSPIFSPANITKQKVLSLIEPQTEKRSYNAKSEEA